MRWWVLSGYLAAIAQTSLLYPQASYELTLPENILQTRLSAMTQFMVRILSSKNQKPRAATKGRICGIVSRRLPKFLVPLLYNPHY